MPLKSVYFYLLLSIVIMAVGFGIKIFNVENNSLQLNSSTTIEKGHSTGTPMIGGSFSLINQDGNIISNETYRGKYVLIFFGYTFCPDVCPMDVSRNSVAVDILSDIGVTIRPVFITIDPKRDTVEYLADFVANNHPNLIGLTGTEEQIAKVARAYKVYYKKQPGDDDEYYLVDHSSFTYLMMPEFGFVDFLRSDLSPQTVADRVACVVKAS